ncbi:MAG: hypothetical protein P4L50_23650 [Anaerolineaceae bacterium]|nr:hypothetical protein [Anaerolineaceae bacterium]
MQQHLDAVACQEFASIFKMDDANWQGLHQLSDNFRDLLGEKITPHRIWKNVNGKLKSPAIQMTLA